MLGHVEHQTKASGSNPSTCKALLAGFFAPLSLFDRAKQAPQQRWRIPSVLGVRATHRAGT
jgi:hypothetical protein